jgi:hypothetical protein
VALFPGNQHKMQADIVGNQRYPNFKNHSGAAGVRRQQKMAFQTPSEETKGRLKSESMLQYCYMHFPRSHVPMLRISEGRTPMLKLRQRRENNIKMDLEAKR